MGKKKRSGGKSSRQTAAPSPRAASKTAKPANPRDRLLDNLLLGLCGAGALLTTYLTFVAWFGEQPLYCSEGSDCDLVQSSRWSTLLGMPMAFWGLLTYLVLAYLVWKRRTRASTWRTALLVAVVGVGISIYLTAVSVIQIEATCIYCLTSFAIISSILALVLLRKPPDNTQFPWGKSLGTPLATAVLVVVVLQMHFSGVFDAAAGPENPDISALARHLDETGAKFYGAYWCPSCEKQKELFQASAERLPYVECSPHGRGTPQSTTCQSLQIADYPTWIIRGQRVTGMLTLEELARYSGFDVPEGGF